MTEQQIKQYDYDAKFNIESGKFLGKLYNHFNKFLTDEEYSEIKIERLNLLYEKGYRVIFKDISRRYMMGQDGTWYETPNLNNHWVSIGFPVNDDTIDSFVYEVREELIK